MSSSSRGIAEGNEIPTRKLLWTAPELLSSSNSGTKAGDIYSFGVIVQEVTLQDEPFAGKNLSPEEIVQRIKDGDMCMRPEVPDCKLIIVLNLMN